MNYEKLDLEELYESSRLMSKAMGLKQPEMATTPRLFEHLLFDAEYNGLEGRQGWITFLQGFLGKLVINC